MSTPNNKQHWAQEKERGTVMGITLILYCFKLLGATVCKVIMVPVLLYYFLFNGKARRSLKQYLVYLNTRHSAMPKASNFNVWRIFLNFGFGVVDKMLVWQGKFKRFNLTKTNSDVFLNLINEKKGAVILVSHLGNFEISRMFSSTHKNTPFNIFMHTKNARKITQVIKKLNPEYDVSIIQGDELNMHTAMFLKEKVDAGEFVVIAGDRVPVNNNAAVVAAEFLGQPANFPIGPYVLAKVLGCPLIGLTCTHTGKGVYHLQFELFAKTVQFNRLNRQLVLTEYVNQYAQSLERQLQKSPLQWYNFHDFWQQ